MERFWPSLIDRLDTPERDTSPLDDHFVDQATLKTMIKDSLERLLNTVHLESHEPLEGYEHVRRSVLNYGVPDATGKLAHSLDAAQFQRRLREAIATYEPRFRAESLRVLLISREEAEKASESPLTLMIEGEIWATPTPERVILKTLLDLEGEGATVEVE